MTMTANAYSDCLNSESVRKQSLKIWPGIQEGWIYCCWCVLLYALFPSGSINVHGAFLYGNPLGNDTMQGETITPTCSAHLYCFCHKRGPGKLENITSHIVSFFLNFRKLLWDHYTLYGMCLFRWEKERFFTWHVHYILYVCKNVGWLQLHRHCHRITFQRLLMVPLENKEQIPTDVFVSRSVHYVIIIRCYICILKERASFERTRCIATIEVGFIFETHSVTVAAYCIISCLNLCVFFCVC